MTKAEELANQIAAGYGLKTIDEQAIARIIESYGRLVQEAAAKECIKQRELFLSPEYAVGQPMSSFAERFACSDIERHIREMPLP